MSELVEFVPLILLDKRSGGLALESQALALEMVEISTRGFRRLKTSTEATQQAG
jgi:hypothetical protein